MTLYLSTSFLSAQISVELAQAEQKIQKQAAQLECSLRGVLHEQYLEKFISEDHWDTLNVNPVRLLT